MPTLPSPRGPSAPHVSPGLSDQVPSLQWMLDELADLLECLDGLARAVEDHVCGVEVDEKVVAFDVG